MRAKDTGRRVPIGTVHRQVVTVHHIAKYHVSHNAEGSPSAVSKTDTTHTQPDSEHAAQFTVVRSTVN